MCFDVSQSSEVLVICDADKTKFMVGLDPDLEESHTNEETDTTMVTQSF